MRDGTKHEMASKEKFIVAGRRNRTDETRLNIKLECYDKDKVKRCFSINEQMKRLLADIESTRRTTGHSKEAQQPTDRGDTTYQKSIHYNTPNRLTEKRLSRWRECERNLQHFLRQHQGDDSSRAREASTHRGDKSPVYTRLPTGVQSSQVQPRPYTAVETHSRQEEHTAIPTSTTHSGQDFKAIFRQQGAIRRPVIVRCFESCEIDTISESLATSASDSNTDEQVNTDWRHEKTHRPHFESVQRNNFVGDGRITSTTSTKISDNQVDLEHRRPSSASKHPSKTDTNKPVTQVLTGKVRRVLKPQNMYELKHTQTFFRRPIIVSKSRRKRMLDELVDHSSPNEKEIVMFKRLQLCKREQHIMTKATQAFCAHIAELNKCDRSVLSIQ